MSWLNAAVVRGGVGGKGPDAVMQGPSFRYVVKFRYTSNNLECVPTLPLD